MVGVAGRSQGCIVCRKRKVKCDEARPFCERCKRANRECKGYEDHREFINTTYEPTVEGRAGSASRIAAQAHLPAECVPLIDLLAFQDNVELSYLIAKILGKIFANERTNSAQDWTSEDSKTTVIAREAILALAKSINARKSGGRSEDITAASLQYSQAIKLLHGHLTSKTSTLNLSVVVAILFCYYYEMSSATNPTGWLLHGSALGVSVERLGPSTFQSEEARMLFHVCRLNLIYVSMIQQKTTFLEKMRWKTTPWQRPGVEKSHIQTLLDPFCDLPGLLESSATLLKADEQTSLSHVQSVEAHKHRLLSCFEDLVAWRWQWEAEFPDAVMVAEASSGSNLYSFEAEKIPFSTVFEFSDFLRAREVTTFAGILLHVVRDIQLWFGEAAHEAMSSALPPDIRPRAGSHLLLLHNKLSRLQIMCEIFRCLDYMLDGPAPSSGALHVCFPLWSCYPERHITEPDTLWAKIERLSGFEIAKSLKTYRAPQDLSRP